ncbi:methyltransferase domain-containing protein [Gimesia chilikensis]|uniref:methyltransferase domain-containing protein n=1 Tax=Gimesia chilikensis TaxID=2605989 RepID=UPI001189CDEF|nr:methyltransferase domain-containing protein [Gimesia chilikensis]MCR9231780.1 class I SAM-dependent methyltransferase [bacterium]QDT87621.1 hypothetical protein MalM14_53090 [Gimesia chilikensis]
MTVDITSAASNLVQNSSGIWVARDQRDISYPLEGNEVCFSVEDSSFWFQHRNEVIPQLVQTFSPCSTFFDIGGGNGCISYALQQRGVDTVLVEPGPAGAYNGLSRGLKTVVQSTLQDAGFTSNSLPSAGIFDVLEHIDSDQDFLKSLHHFLEPEGILYITVPAYRFLWSREDDYSGHFRRYTISLLEKDLNSAGFEVLFSSYLFACLVPPIFLFRTLPSLMRIRKVPTAVSKQKEHKGGNRLSAKFIKRCLHWEQSRIKKIKRVPFGSSCIAVARKLPRDA